MVRGAWRGVWTAAAAVAVAAASVGGGAFVSVRVAGATTTTVANPDPTLITEWKPCQPGAGVTEFVDFGPLGSGKVDVSCAPTAAAQANGFQALTHAGFAHATRPSTPGFLTTITSRLRNRSRFVWAGAGSRSPCEPLGTTKN